jgi:hypothetical protein
VQIGGDRNPTLSRYLREAVDIQQIHDGVGAAAASPSNHRRLHNGGGIVKALRAWSDQKSCGTDGTNRAVM